MSRKACALGLFTCVVLVGAGRVQAIELQGWGTVVNPSGDCTVRGGVDRLVLYVPQGVHDLWYGQADKSKLFNAPRLVQEVAGNFVAQVKVTADWKPSLTRYYHGAGLIVWDTEKQYIRWERNSCINTKGQAFCFTSPMYDRDDRRINAMKATADEFFQGRSTWLRIERSGQQITTSYSHDGRQWTESAVLQSTELPPTVRVGIHAVNDSSGDFTVEFAEFSVAK